MTVTTSFQGHISHSRQQGGKAGASTGQHGQYHYGARLPDFDLKAETDRLMNRTEQLFGKSMSSQQEWVI
jgi:hypothetical protein